MTHSNQQQQAGTGKSGARDSVLVQAGILAAASMIVRVIGLLYRAPLTAIIGDVGNGLYGTAYNIYTIILMVSSYSVPSAISKMIAQKLATGDRKSAQRVYYCALLYGLIVGVIGSAILFFGAGLLVPSNAVPVLRVFAPIIFLFGILGSLRGYFQGHGSMVETSISQILEQLANAVVSIGAAWLLMHLAAGASDEVLAERGAIGSALGTGAGVGIAIVFMLVCYIRYRRQHQTELDAAPLNEEPLFRLLTETVLVITPFMLSGVILNLTTSLNQTIYYNIIIDLKGLDEMSATTLYGIFSNKAVVISNIPISIATAISSAIIPGLSAAYAKGDRQEAVRRARNAFQITCLIAVPAAVALALMSEPIMTTMFPQQESLALASQLLSMVGVTVLFYSVGTVANAVLQSIGQMTTPLVSAGIALGIQTLVLEILLRQTEIGIYALALVSILYSALIFTINELCLRRYLGHCLDIKRMILQPLGCAILMALNALVVYYLLHGFLEQTDLFSHYWDNLLALIPAVIAAILLYAFLVVRTGVMSAEQILSFPKGDKMLRFMKKMKWLA